MCTIAWWRRPKSVVKLNIVCTRSGFAQSARNGANRGDAHLCLPRSEVSRVAPDVVCVPLEESPMKWFYCTIAKKGSAIPYLLRFFSGKEDFVLWKD